MQYQIMTGNPVDGFAFVGPYDDEEFATSEAEKYADQEWWVIALTPPYNSATWHVNVYERHRNHGGPEEGGWWFDSGVYQPQMSVTFDRSEYVVEDVNHFALGLQERLNAEADEAGVPAVHSVTYTGGRYTVQTDDKAGADWPTEPPHYE